MGAALDHDRHLPRRLGARPLAAHGRALSLLPPRRQPEGQRKEGEVTRTPPKTTPTRGDIRQGFVYERVPHITLEVDRQQCRDRRDLGEVAGDAGAAARRAERGARHRRGRNGKSRASSREPGLRGDQSRTPSGGRRGSRRQKEIDASIAAKAEFEYLYDKPYVDNSRIRVAGPFTVESLSPHRTLAVDWNDELIDMLDASEAGAGHRTATRR